MLFISQLVNGIITGSGYSIVAVGLTYTLGLAQIFNFAYGAFYVLAAYNIIDFVGGVHNYYLASALGIATVGLSGAIFALLVIFPTLKRAGLTVMVATLGIDIALTNLMQRLFGSQVQSIDSPLTQQRLVTGRIVVNTQDLITVVGAVVLTGFLSWFVLHTRPGSRLRAAAENPDLAASSGVDVRKMYLLAVVIGIMIAGFGAALYAPLTVVTTSSGDTILLIAFATIAFAGVGRLWGALLVGMGLGVFESLFVQYINSTLAEVAIYGGLIALLAVRPRGLFGGYA